MSSLAEQPNAIASASRTHLSVSSPHVRHRHDKKPASATSDRPPRYSAKRSRRKGRKGWKGRFRWFGSWKVGEGWVTEGFRRFGEHCARNQIRTLLIDCLVMTNLFYPSLALYQQKRAQPSDLHSPSAYSSHPLPLGAKTSGKDNSFTILGMPVLDTFFPYPPPLLPRLHWAGWWGRDTGQEEEAGWTAIRAPVSGDAYSGDEEIRLMRVGWADIGDVLNLQTSAGAPGLVESDDPVLQLMRDIAEDWEKQDPSSGQSCVRQIYPDDHNIQQGPCYILSSQMASSGHDVPLTPLATLTSDNASHSTGLVDAGSIYHSLALPFRVRTNGTLAFSSRWTSAMANLSAQVNGQAFVEASTAGDQTGAWWLSYGKTAGHTLSHDPSTPSEVISPSPPRLVLFLYFVLLTTLLAQLSNASKVHSRFGLAFTGVVQLCCSSVMSFSVLALLGWNGWGSSRSQSSLPTYVLPFVIVVVGAENMSTLTKAIFSIPFTHSVPVRIGLGLSKVGTTIALTSLTDLLLLGVVWLCVNLQPVREFCLFAAVVIVTDWFMLHTFFLTVLSIDAQRLELADVLASNGVAPTTPATPNKEEDRNDGRGSGFSWRKVLRARTTKSGSLVLLLISVGLLYWFTERHRLHPATSAGPQGYSLSSRLGGPTAVPSSLTPFSTPAADWTQLSDAEKFWRAINPSGWPFAHVVIPPASIVILPKAGHPIRPADIRNLCLRGSRLLIPRLKPLFYLLKFLVLPQALTAGALYALVLYLLKDADLLDAQRNRLGRVDGPQDSSSEALTVPSVSAQMLPCSHETDVELIVSSTDGRLTLSVAVDNTIVLWRFSDVQSGSGTREPLTSALSATTDDPIVAAAVSEDRRHVAVVSEGSALQVWDVPEDGQTIAQPLRKVSIPSDTSVMDVAFDTMEVATEDPFSPISPQKADPSYPTTLLLALSDGSVISYSASGDMQTTVISAQPRQVTRSTFVLLDGRLSYTVLTSQTLSIWRKSDSRWNATTLSSDRSDDRITATSSPCSTLPGLYALALRSGCIEIHDKALGCLASIAPASSESIRKVAIARPASSRCVRCGTSSEGWFVISSTSSQVYVDRVAPKATSTFCRCAIRRGSSLDDLYTAGQTPIASSRFSDPTIVVPPTSSRSRLSPHDSPRKSPSLLPPSNGEFPLSSHGGARRFSNLHRDDTQTDPSSSPLAPLSMQKARPTSPLDRNLNANSNGSPSHTLPCGEMDSTPLGSILIDSSGGWTIAGDILVGIRRAREGIDDSQWQVITLDLNVPWNGQTLVVGAKPLAELLFTNHQSASSKSKTKSKAGLLSPSTAMGASISIRDRRTERLLSLNGQASFPERRGTGTSTGSFSVSTYPALGYVSVRSCCQVGEVAILAGLGNRLGLLVLDKRDGKDQQDQRQGQGQRRATTTTTGITTTSMAVAVGGNSGTLLASNMGWAGGGPTPLRPSASNMAAGVAFTPPPPRTSVGGTASKRE